MGLNLIITAVVLFCVAGGGALVWHSIGSAAVAKHEQAVKVEQDKVDARAAASIEAGKVVLAARQDAFEEGRKQRGIAQKAVYDKGQDYIRTVPAAQSKDCVIPQDGMDMLNKARAAEAARIFGFTDTDPVKIIVPWVATVPAAASPPTAPPVPGSRPKPVPAR